MGGVADVDGEDDAEEVVEEVDLREERGIDGDKEAGERGTNEEKSTREQNQEQNQESTEQ